MNDGIIIPKLPDQEICTLLSYVKMTSDHVKESPDTAYLATEINGPFAKFSKDNLENIGDLMLDDRLHQDPSMRGTSNIRLLKITSVLLEHYVKNNVYNAGGSNENTIHKAILKMHTYVTEALTIVSNNSHL